MGLAGGGGGGGAGVGGGGVGREGGRMTLAMLGRDFEPEVRGFVRGARVCVLHVLRFKSFP